MTRLTSLLPLLALLACRKESPMEAPPPAQETEGTPGITGGREVLDSSPVAKATVALAATGQRGLQAFCSGTLIGPKAVLTAAHCVDGTFSIVFARRLGSSEAPVRQVAQVVVHPQYNPNGPENPSLAAPPNDIAVVLLREAAPAGHVPAVLGAAGVRTPSDALVGGYGVSRNRNLADTGVLREVTVPIGSVNAMRRTFDTGRDDLWNPHGACAGDSGGPAYGNINGVWQLLGVLSTGSELFGFCLGSNTYTDVRAYGDWISKTAGGSAASNSGSGRGTTGADSLAGTADDDALYGLDGDDVLNGNSGSDVLYGGPGNDTLAGNAGDDRLSGGPGNDRFVYEAGGGSDVIFDGGAGSDVLEVRGAPLSSIRCRRHGEDLLVQIGTGSVRIVNHFAGEGLASVPCTQ